MTTRPRATRTFPLLPDPPEREPEDMTSFTHLTKTGSVRDLVLHLGNPATTIVEGERRLWPTPDSPVSGRMVPDLLIAFGTDPSTALVIMVYLMGHAPTSCGPVSPPPRGSLRHRRCDVLVAATA